MTPFLLDANGRETGDANGREVRNANGREGLQCLWKKTDLVIKGINLFFASDN